MRTTYSPSSPIERSVSPPKKLISSTWVVKPGTPTLPSQKRARYQTASSTLPAAEAMPTPLTTFSGTVEPAITESLTIPISLLRL